MESILGNTSGLDGIMEKMERRASVIIQQEFWKRLDEIDYKKKGEPAPYDMTTNVPEDAPTLKTESISKRTEIDRNYKLMKKVFHAQGQNKRNSSEALCISSISSPSSAPVSTRSLNNASILSLRSIASYDSVVSLRSVNASPAASRLELAFGSDCKKSELFPFSDRRSRNRKLKCGRSHAAVDLLFLAAEEKKNDSHDTLFTSNSSSTNTIVLSDNSIFDNGGSNTGTLFSDNSMNDVLSNTTGVSTGVSTPVSDDIECRANKARNNFLSRLDRPKTVADEQAASAIASAIRVVALAEKQEKKLCNDSQEYKLPDVHHQELLPKEEIEDEKKEICTENKESLNIHEDSENHNQEHELELRVNGSLSSDVRVPNVSHEETKNVDALMASAGLSHIHKEPLKDFIVNKKSTVLRRPVTTSPTRRRAKLFNQREKMETKLRYSSLRKSVVSAPTSKSGNLPHISSIYEYDCMESLQQQKSFMNPKRYQKPRMLVPLQNDAHDIKESSTKLTLSKKSSKPEIKVATAKNVSTKLHSISKTTDMLEELIRSRTLSIIEPVSILPPPNRHDLENEDENWLGRNATDFFHQILDEDHKNQLSLQLESRRPHKCPRNIPLISISDTKLSMETINVKKETDNSERRQKLGTYSKDKKSNQEQERAEKPLENENQEGHKEVLKRENNGQAQENTLEHGQQQQEQQETNEELDTDNEGDIFDVIDKKAFRLLDNKVDTPKNKVPQMYEPAIVAPPASLAISQQQEQENVETFSEERKKELELRKLRNSVQRFKRAIRLLMLTIRHTNALSESLRLRTKREMTSPHIVVNQPYRISFNVDAFRCGQTTISKKMRLILIKEPHWRSASDMVALTQLIMTFKYFDKYSNYVKRELCHILHYHCYTTDRVVVRQNDPASSFYFIFSGSVSVFVNSNDPTGDDNRSTLVTKLRHGDTFGELALIRPVTRQATVVCNETTEFLSVDRDDFQSVLKHSTQQEMLERLLFVSKHDLFRSWSLPYLQNLTEICTIKEFPPGMVIMRKDSTSDEIFFILSGECEVVTEVFFVQSDARKSDGHHGITYVQPNQMPRLQPGEQLKSVFLKVQRLGQGDCFGEGDKMGKTMRTVLTMCPVQCMLVSKLFFFKFDFGRTLDKLQNKVMRELPNNREIFKVFMQQRKWESYKENVVENVINKRHKICERSNECPGSPKAKVKTKRPKTSGNNLIK